MSVRRAFLYRSAQRRERRGARLTLHLASWFVIRDSGFAGTRSLQPSGRRVQACAIVCYAKGGADVTSIVPGGSCFLKIATPRRPPMVEKTAPTHIQNISATIRPMIMNANG
jgi:hypothetical protein